MNKEYIYDSEGILLDSEGSLIDQEAYSVEISRQNPLVKEGDKIIDDIITEKDPDKLDNLTKLFSLTQKKKQLARINKLSKLLDKVDNEVINRFESNPEVIEDRDLYRYWQTTSDIVNNKSEEDINLPRVQINNQTNINVNASGLNRDSRAKVLEVVNKILSDAKNEDVIDAVITDNTSKGDD